MTTNYSDIHRDIVEKSKKGDVKAQYKLYKLYSKAMYNICLRMMNNIVEAEDMLQESFSYAFHKLDTFRYESSFGAWLKRIVVNRCINELKRRKTDLLYVDMNKYDKGEEVVEKKDIQYEVKRVHDAISKLPDGYRIVFSLYLLEGYDHSEISEIMGITESTSKSQYMRAKRKLQSILATN